MYVLYMYVYFCTLYANENICAERPCNTIKHTYMHHLRYISGYLHSKLCKYMRVYVCVFSVDSVQKYLTVQAVIYAS